jgi:hypothetical protein
MTTEDKIIEGDCGYLYDATGAMVSRYCYEMN